MKNAFLFHPSATLKSTPVLRYFLFCLFLFLCSQQNMLHAQAKLSIQGILKKASGEAVADGNYHLIFKLYTTETGGADIWSEDQSSVEVVSGIYSAVLGNITPLTISFNSLYYLGVTVGSTEMTPRTQLTSAPYALALIGTTNQFPSSGIVKADSIRVAGGVLADSGAPGANGDSKNGYAFSGDKDSGLFSTAASEASVFVNNNEILEVKPTVVTLKNDATLRLDTLGKISYNGLNDWRLIYEDYFQNGLNNWKAYSPTGAEWTGWNSSSVAGNPTVVTSNTNLSGPFVMPTSNKHALKKSYDLSDFGSFSFIKVKFKYYFLDTWDDGQDGDRTFAGIAETVSGTGLRLGWSDEEKTWYDYPGALNQSNSALFNTAANLGGQATTPDFSKNVEMTFAKCTSCSDPNTFWLIFGAGLNSEAPNENYAVGMIEIWVK